MSLNKYDDLYLDYEEALLRRNRSRRDALKRADGGPALIEEVQEEAAMFPRRRRDGQVWDMEQYDRKRKAGRSKTRRTGEDDD
ncbi:MAG: hypothetical protein MUE40_19585 [Anaerolineae bacterium]|jgi:hypothetical protein|nr:hypothetical protein [Anaerolineae bacterium]